jgi:hypothetical protein
MGLAGRRSLGKLVVGQTPWVLTWTGQQGTEWAATTDGLPRSRPIQLYGDAKGFVGGGSSLLVPRSLAGSSVFRVPTTSIRCKSDARHRCCRLATFGFPMLCEQHGIHASQILEYPMQKFVQSIATGTSRRTKKGTVHEGYYLNYIYLNGYNFR